MQVDERVHQLLSAGDVRSAATEAIRALGPSIVRYLRSILRDEEAAADAFSQFAENLWRGLSAFRGASSLRTWAYRLAWNAALNLQNEAWRRRGRRLATGEASAIAEEVRTKTAVVVERQHRALDELRRSLSVEERALLSLRVDQGLAWNEIAEIMAGEGEPVDAAALMKRFARLKERLRRVAQERHLLE